MSESIKLLLRFLVHIIVASLLFAIIAAIAYLLWWGTEWMKRQGVSDHIYLGVWAVSELLFALDVLCFVVFVVAEVIKLLREIVSNVWRK